MHWPYLDRALRGRTGMAAKIERWGAAALVAVVVSAMAVGAGLQVHSLVARDIVAAPDYVKQPTDALFGALLDPRSPIADWSLPTLCAWSGGLSLLLIGLWLLIARNGQRDAQRAITALRDEIYRKAITSGAALGQRAKNAEHLFVDQCEPLRRGFAAAWQLRPRSQLCAAALLATALAVDPWLTLLTAALAAVGYWQFQVAIGKAEEHSQEQHGRAAQTESLLLESLRLAPLAVLFPNGDPPAEPFERRLEPHAQAELRRHLARSQLGAKGLTLLLLCGWLITAVFCLTDRLTLSEGAALFVALGGAAYFALTLVRIRRLFENADNAARAIYAFLDRPTDLPIRDTPLDVPELSESLRLENVTLNGGDGRPLLENASCQIAAGKRVSVISTDTRAPAALARVAARLVDPSSGQVLLDGKDLRDLHLDQLRSRCIVVSAAPMLFTGSIAENICCGMAFSPQQIDDACRRAGSLECFKQLPQGLDTIVGPLGIDLPEVTEYRIALARALIREPRLLIIEEPRVENGQSEQLGEAIDAAAAGCTTLVLAAEAEQLRRADRVLLIHQGRVAETGSHAELLRDSDLYRHLNYMRFHPYR